MSNVEVTAPVAASKTQMGGTSTMQLKISRLLRGLTGVILLGLAGEVYLVGTKLFGATTYQPHRVLGLFLAIAILLLPVLALAARRGRRVVGLSGLLVALTMVQIGLPVIATTFPWLAALHAINTMAMMGVTMSIYRDPAAEATSAATPLMEGDSGLSAHGRVRGDYQKPTEPVAPQL